MENDGICRRARSSPPTLVAKQQEYQDGFLHKLKSFFELKKSTRPGSCSA